MEKAVLLDQAMSSVGGTRPGSLLRQQIPIAGVACQQEKAGYLQVDTVALCGGSLEGDQLCGRANSRAAAAMPS